MSGQVLAQCRPRHRHQEFLAFLRSIDKAVPAELDVHCIADNYASHKHPKVRAWLAERPGMTRRGLSVPAETALFLGRGGHRLKARAIQLRVAAWARKQGLAAHVHPHMFRHSFATHLLESSGNLRGVQELLGHADIGTTQIYTHLDFQHLALVYDATHPRARKRQ